MSYARLHGASKEDALSIASAGHPARPSAPALAPPPSGSNVLTAVRAISAASTQEITLLTGELAAARERLAQQSAQVLTLKQTNEQLSEKLAAITEQNAGVARAVESARSERAALVAELAALHEQEASGKSTLSALESDLEALGRDVAAAEQDLSATSASAASAAAEAASRLAELETSSAVRERELQATLASQSALLSQAQMRIASLRERVGERDRLEDSCASLRQRLGQTKAAAMHAALVAAMKEGKDAKARLEAHLAQVQASAARAHSELLASSAHRDELQRSLSASIAEKQRAAAELLGSKRALAHAAIEADKHRARMARSSVAAAAAESGTAVDGASAEDASTRENTALGPTSPLSIFASARLVEPPTTAAKPVLLANDLPSPSSLSPPLFSVTSTAPSAASDAQAKALGVLNSQVAALREDEAVLSAQVRARGAAHAATLASAKASSAAHAVSAPPPSLSLLQSSTVSDVDLKEQISSAAAMLHELGLGST